MNLFRRALFGGLETYSRPIPLFDTYILYRADLGSWVTLEVHGRGFHASAVRSVHCSAGGLGWDRVPGDLREGWAPGSGDAPGCDGGDGGGLSRREATAADLRGSASSDFYVPLEMSLRWRKVLGAVLVVLLPLPLVLVMGGAWLRAHQHRTIIPPDARIVPILSPDEARGLLTYRRSCAVDEDCEFPLACLDVLMGGERVCIDSACTTDSQCKEGFTCRLRKTPGGGSLVRQCTLIGLRTEGQPCFVSSTLRERTCAREFICNGYCGRSCQLEQPSSCPKGFVCRDGAQGPSCQPSCEDAGCPAGQQCVGAGTGDAVCAVVLGENCMHRPCSDGLQCKVSPLPGEEVSTVSMECVKPCSEERSCPGELVCRWGACRQRCAPDNREVCGPRQYCVRYEHDPVWFCEPRLR